MILHYINITIVFHCLVFSVFFLVKKKGIRKANYFLAVLLFLLAFISVPFSLKGTGWIFHLPYLVDLEWPAAFLFGPVYFWYVREMIGEKIELKKLQLLHLIPGLLAFLYFSKFHFKNPVEKLEYIKLISHSYTEEYQLADTIFYTMIHAYFIYTLVYLIRKKASVPSPYSLNVAWLRNYTLTLITFSIFGASVFFFAAPQWLVDSLPLTSAVLYFFMVFKSIQQPLSYSVFQEKNEAESKAKYSNSNLTTEEATRLNLTLIKLMSEEKPFLQSELSLNSLAEQLQTSPHFLSQVINQFQEKNFSDFVNIYRIQEAQRLISETSNLKLEAVAYDCGFNTKTTFNITFKKITGFTPSEFRKSLHKNISEKSVHNYNN